MPFGITSTLVLAAEARGGPHGLDRVAARSVAADECEERQLFVPTRDVDRVLVATTALADPTHPGHDAQPEQHDWTSMASCRLLGA